MKTVTYDLYGFESDDLDSFVESLEQLLDIKFEARSSDYWGDYYRYGRKTGESFELKRNLDGEGELLKPKFSNKGALFYVNRTNRAEEIEKALLKNIKGIIKLEHEALEVKQ